MEEGGVRRRKKRISSNSSSTNSSSLSAFNRNSIRVVELLRRPNGYGFTISGQKPCLLRSILDGSPAAGAGLKTGHSLVGVNGRDVSHLLHDEVVRIIANCTGLLRLHVAESYFSESSEDESVHSRERCGGVSSGRVRVFDSLEELYELGGMSKKKSVSSCCSSGSNLSTKERQKVEVIVGYVGSIEVPSANIHKRHETLSHSIRIFKKQRRCLKYRSLVCLRIEREGVRVFGRGESGVSFYESSQILFTGAVSEDRRFFGLVTSTSPTTSNSSSLSSISCHVFIVEPKLLPHSLHSSTALSFSLSCSPLHKGTGNVLGLQECVEFPGTPDPILSAILSLHPRSGESRTGCSSVTSSSTPTNNNNMSETLSSNSDSGIGNEKIYDIVHPTSSSLHSHLLQSKISPKTLGLHLSSMSSSGKEGGKKRTSVPHATSEGKGKGRTQGTGGREGESCSLAPKSLPLSHPKPKVRSGGGGVEVLKTSSPEFESDPASLREILRETRPPSIVAPPQPKPRLSRLLTRRREGGESGSEEECLSNSALYPVPVQRKSLGKLSRSLDDLCGSDSTSLPPAVSTPALYQESGKDDGDGDEFWNFKIPSVPHKEKSRSGVDHWAESIEKLLADPNGLEIFTEFLERNFSAENIHFYTACLRYKEAYPTSTQSQQISMASTIFQTHLQNGASDAINVDHQARSIVEKKLGSPCLDMFEAPLSQVFNLLKFDCYPRFLKSDLFRDYNSGLLKLLSDSESERSGGKIQGRRRSLLPWNIKTRNKKRNKNDLNSDVCLIEERESCRLCRLLLPDNSTTVLPCKPGESLSTVVQRLLQKREFPYTAFELISLPNGKALDLNMEVSELTAREVRVEPRVFIEIELPKGWKVGIRANPIRKISEVLKPLLSQHSLKLENILIHSLETGELIDLKTSVGKFDGQTINVESKTKDENKDEMNHIYELHSSHERIITTDEDQQSGKSSGQGSSVFRGFLRRSSKKYKKGKESSSSSNSTNKIKRESMGGGGGGSDEIYGFSSSNKLILSAKNETKSPLSPLSLIQPDFVSEGSRNRKPIYITNSNESTK